MCICIERAYQYYSYIKNDTQTTLPPLADDERMQRAPLFEWAMDYFWALVRCCINLLSPLTNSSVWSDQMDIDNLLATEPNLSLSCQNCLANHKRTLSHLATTKLPLKFSQQLKRCDSKRASLICLFTTKLTDLDRPYARLEQKQRQKEWRIAPCADAIESRHACSGERHLFARRDKCMERYGHLDCELFWRNQNKNQPHFIGFN